MKKILSIALILVVLYLCYAGFSSGYREKDFIGKTSAEIVKQYGSFDFTTIAVGEDGLYKNCKCGYIVQESSVKFGGTSREMMFFVVFDENGTAVSCFESETPAA